MKKLSLTKVRTSHTNGCCGVRVDGFPHTHAYMAAWTVIQSLKSSLSVSAIVELINMDVNRKRIFYVCRGNEWLKEEWTKFCVNSVLVLGSNMVI